jgi:nicotinamidase-related amidase
MRRLNPEECTVVVIDVQDKLAAAMPKAALAEVERACRILLGAAHACGARALATEQYPEGLGPTIGPVSAALAELGVAPIAKMTFSACDEPRFDRAFTATGARAAIVVGMETHVCVFQTVRELAARGVDVFVPIDGVASRRDDHRATGLDLCRAAGATLTTAETVVFDWLKRAGTPQFKTISKLVR